MADSEVKTDMPGTDMHGTEPPETDIPDTDVAPAAGADEQDSAERSVSASPNSPLEMVIAAAHDTASEAWAELETKLQESTFAVLENGLAKHQEVVESIGLLGEPPEEWLGRSESLLAYRRTVASELLEPLTTAFVHDDVANRIASLASSSIVAAVAAARELPTEIDAEWPTGAMQPREGESFGRRFGKGIGRMFSAARKPGGTRPLPLRGCAVEHVHTVLAPSVDAAAAEALEAWAEWAGRLEGIWVAWGDQGLPALVSAELPDPTVDTTSHWVSVRATAVALNEGLAALIADAPHTATTARIQASIEASRGVLEGELAIAGSFLSKPDPPVASDPVLTRVERAKSGVATWLTEVANRMELYESVLAILSGATAVQRRLVFRVREKALSGATVLPDIASELDELAAGMRPWPESAELDARLTRLEADVTRVLDRALTAIPEREQIAAAVAASADTTAEALQSMMRQAPAQLMLHAEDAKPPTGARKVEGRPLAVQEVARQAFDALRIERVRTSTFGVVDDVAQVHEDIQELPRVFAFAYDAARSELEEDKEGAEGRAEELISQAMTSLAESLRSVKGTLDEAVDEAKTKLAEEISEGAISLFDRVAAGRVHARILAARSSVASLRIWINRTWGPPVERVYRKVTVLAKRLIAFGLALLSRATEMVRGSQAGEAASRRSLRAISDADEHVAALPLVYQRLFTLLPLEDASLLARREVELADAMGRWERWQSDDGVPFVIRGRPGSGITSFINILSTKVKETGARVAKVTLDRRISDEATFATKVSEALGLPPCGSIDDLSRALFAANDDDLPGAVAIDNLEHLYLREPQGTDLIERVLTLMAETEPRIFWIGGVTSSAWQLIAIGEPSAVAQLDILDLPDLSALDVRAAILLRHRRSGLPVRFDEPPATGFAMLRRKFRRMRDPDGFEDLVQAEYFDRLHRTSSGNLRLALFQWMLCADFSRGDGVAMTAPERPDFSVLDSLSLAQSFTLKAFLEHRTLSLDEHDRVFRLPRHESYQLIESLANRHLIEPIRKKTTDGPSQSEIEVDLRYRLRPLLVGAIVTHLSGRNIVH